MPLEEATDQPGDHVAAHANQQAACSQLPGIAEPATDPICSSEPVPTPCRALSPAPEVPAGAQEGLCLPESAPAASSEPILISSNPCFQPANAVESSEISSMVPSMRASNILQNDRATAVLPASAAISDIAAVSAQPLSNAMEHDVPLDSLAASASGTSPVPETGAAADAAAGEAGPLGLSSPQPMTSPAMVPASRLACQPNDLSAAAMQTDAALNALATDSAVVPDERQPSAQKAFVKGVSVNAALSLHHIQLHHGRAMVAPGRCVQPQEKSWLHVTHMDVQILQSSN